MKITKRIDYVTWMFVNLGIVALVGIALYITESLWAFIGLIFLCSIKASTAKCPECGHTFKVKEDDEED